MTTILAPVDGTHAAECSLPTAVAMARLRGACLDLLHVKPTWSHTLNTTPIKGTTMIAAPEDYLERIARDLRQTRGIPVTTHVLQGPAAECICEHADATHPDLIVLGSLKLMNVARLIRGRVVVRVMEHATCPVLIVQVDDNVTESAAAPVRLSRILIAFDGSRVALGAVAAALRFIDRGVSEVHFVQIVKPTRHTVRDTVSSGRRLDREATGIAATRAHAQVRAVADEFADQTNCDTYTHVRVDDDVPDGIIRVAREFNSSLIIVGTDHRDAPRFLAGGIAGQLLRHADVPLLVVRTPDEDGQPNTSEHKAAS